MNDEKIKVLIVDDSDLFRAYINDLLKKTRTLRWSDLQKTAWKAWKRQSY